MTPYHADSAKALAAWLEDHGKALEDVHLDFCKLSLDQSARMALIQGLASARGLRSLVLVNLNLSSPEDQTRLLSPLSHLTELRLRGCRVPPEALTQLSHLQAVELHHPPPGRRIKICHYPMELLADLSSNLQPLNHLTLTGATVPAAAFPILSTLPHLQQLSMAIRSDQETLLQLQQHPSLIAANSDLELHLFSNPGELDDLLGTMKLFSMPNKITSLSFVSSGPPTALSTIGPAVAHVAAATAGSEIQLRSLTLACVQICPSTLVAIGKLTGLTELVLKGCELLDSAYPHVTKLSSLCGLRSLCIEDKSLGKLGPSRFARRGCLTSVSGLTSMPISCHLS